MLSACNQQGKAIIASEVVREDGPFFCPSCRGQVILKQGHVVVDHFAHLPESNCAYGTGESLEHLQAKMAIYTALKMHPEVTSLMVERRFGSRRADVSFLFRGHKVSIEVQYNHAPWEEIAQRTRGYTSNRIHVLWLLPYHDDLLNGEKYAPHDLAKYLHELYRGKVYHWVKGLTVLPVHYDDYRIGDTYYEWFDTYSKKRVGAFGKLSVRFRTLELLDEVNILDLHAVTYGAKRSWPYWLPPASLWCLKNGSDSTR